MPPLADRSNYEASIIAELAPIFQAQFDRAAVARNPSSVPYDRFQADLQQAMAGELFDVFGAAGAALAIGSLGGSLLFLNQGAFPNTARRWAADMSRELAAQIVDTSRRMTSEAFALTRQDRDGLERALSLIYLAPARLHAIAVTECTRAISAGEHAAVIPYNDRIRREGHDDDGRLLIPVWRIDPASNVCEYCLPLDGHSRDVWARRFPYGPPGHPQCACWIEWMRAAEFAERQADHRRRERRAA